MHQHDLARGPPAACGLIYMGVSSSGYPKSWMVYFMENPTKMDDFRGTPLLGNLHTWGGCLRRTILI